ncbi:4-hydroxy-tetrahydrodipicolinate synthase [Propionispira arboris]|uniref:4-hydroxy-tetrahydrodipicolinate synthase n=1 Tax=Propionispira arboris TaxID=84035 RepID=A0A1H6U1C5_9FIRM|nr:4-hydroxy-tetrahydrodipicolinate synthase [Propionispira arboris]SEI81752.1 4-hydroxy-tetrahydrodipicolinate synthase [Propionispira arboris]
MQLKGIITAMVTPFDENQNINQDAAQKLINKLINKGVDGIFILGTNGEFHVLNDDEKIDFTEMVVKVVNKRVPVYVGTGGNSTKHVIELSKRMEKVGADALSIITPFLVPIKQNELVEHYKCIAAKVNMPIVLYNIPKNTGINIAPESVRELARIENIVGIKDSSGDISNIEAYINVSKGEDFSVLSGSDSLILKALQIGATGAIAATSNLLTDIDVAIYRNFIKGDLVQAQKNQDEIEKLRTVLKLGTTPSVIKRAVTLSGINVGSARSPVSAVNAEIDEKIQETLTYYNLH